jgi:hypothetical protein
MSTLSIPQAIKYARNAGFRGVGLVYIVAIAIAESGLNTQAHNASDPYGGSWGILQINGSHFISGTTTKQCALNPACSFKFGYELSNGGKDFHDWGTYTNGSYRQYTNEVQKDLGQNVTLPPDPTSPQPPLATPSIYASSSSQDGTGLAVFGVGIGAVVAGAAILAVVGFVVWKSV